VLLKCSWCWGHQTVTKAREAALRVINVVFPGKDCSSSNKWRVRWGWRRSVLLAARGLSAEGTAHARARSDDCGLTLSAGRAAVGTRQAKAEAEAQSPPTPPSVPALHPPLPPPLSPAPASSRPISPSPAGWRTPLISRVVERDIRRARTSGVRGPWGLGDVLCPSLHHTAQAQSGPCQAHLYHTRSLPWCRSLRVKLSKHPAPQGSSRRLCKDKLPGRLGLLGLPSGCSPASTAQTPSGAQSPDATMSLPPLTGTGTGLQLLPCCENPGCRPPAVSAAGGRRAAALAWGLSRTRPAPKPSPAPCSQRPEGKVMSKVLGRHFGNQKISLSQHGLA